MFESKFKNIVYGGEVPTIVDAEKYKQRFKRAMKRYFVGMCIQEEKVPGLQLAAGAGVGGGIGGRHETQQEIAEEQHSSDDDCEVANETRNGGGMDG